MVDALAVNICHVTLVLSGEDDGASCPSFKPFGTEAAGFEADRC
jgi:hypothetical protein